MTTRTDMVTRLRQELGDEAAPYTWSDDYLNNLVIEGAAALGQEFPLKVTVSQNVALGQRTFTLARRIAVTRVECPKGKWLPEDLGAATAVDSQPYVGGVRQGWALEGDTLYLRHGAAGSEIGALNLVVHMDQEWSTPDPADHWEGTPQEEHLLIAWAAYHAWYFLEGKQARLGRAANTKPRETAEKRLEELKRMRRRRFHSRSLESEG